jgi:hypothetical protein
MNVDRAAFFHALLRVVPGEYITEAERRQALAMLAAVDAGGLSRACISKEDVAAVMTWDKRCHEGAAAWAHEQMIPPDMEASRPQCAKAMREAILARCAKRPCA